jgi:hypothetical protein
MGWIFLLIGAGVSFYLIRDNLTRSRRKMEFALKPNCLLSKNPLLFVGGKKSIFYCLQYWGMIPSYLTQHGYEVHELDLPWRKDHLRELSFVNFLKEQEECGGRFHLFFDESSLPMMQKIFARESFKSVASNTLVAPEFTEVGSASLQPLRHSIEVLPMNFKKKSGIWRWHCLWTQQQKKSDARLNFEFNERNDDFFQSFLERTVQLAEKDFVESTKASSGEPHHDQPSERLQGDLFRFAEIP